VWRRADRELALRSNGAPTEALKPDFQDGLAIQPAGDDRWHVYALSDATGRVQVQVGRLESALQRELMTSLRKGLFGAAGALLALCIAVGVVVRWSLKPVAAIQQAVAQRAPLDLRPLPVDNLPDEIRPLVESFNSLLAQLDTTMQSERRFIADAAHELRTPLAALMAHAQLALRAESPETAKDALLKVIAGVERGARLSEQLLDSARLDARKAPDSAQRVDLHEIVGVVAHEFELMAAQRGQSLSVETEPCTIDAHVDDLGILIRNLIDNAIRYAGQGARIAVRCASQDARAILSIVDNGPGVPPEERARIFDRFYRAPGSMGRGSGIGLSLVSRIAQVHGATVNVGNGLEGKGLAITVSFPCQVAPASASSNGNASTVTTSAPSTSAAMSMQAR
jgi:two-component system OmpR family sensor kinase